MAHGFAPIRSTHKERVRFLLRQLQEKKIVLLFFIRILLEKKFIVEFVDMQGYWYTNKKLTSKRR